MLRDKEKDTMFQIVIDMIDRREHSVLDNVKAYNEVLNWLPDKDKMQIKGVK